MKWEVGRNPALGVEDAAELLRKCGYCLVDDMTSSVSKSFRLVWIHENE